MVLQVGTEVWNMSSMFGGFTHRRQDRQAITRSLRSGLVHA